MAHAAGGRSSPTPLPPLAPTGLELQIQDIFGSDADSTLSLGKEEVQNKVSGLFEALKELRKSVEASPSDHFHLDPLSSAVKPPLIRLPPPESFLRKNVKLASRSTSGRPIAVKPANGLDTRPSASRLVSVPEVPAALAPSSDLWHHERHVEQYVSAHLPSVEGGIKSPAFQLRLVPGSRIGSGVAGSGTDDCRASFSLNIGTSTWGFVEFGRRRRRQARPRRLHSDLAEPDGVEKMEVAEDYEEQDHANDPKRAKLASYEERSDVNRQEMIAIRFSLFAETERTRPKGKNDISSYLSFVELSRHLDSLELSLPELIHRIRAYMSLATLPCHACGDLVKNGLLPVGRAMQSTEPDAAGHSGPNGSTPSQGSWVAYHLACWQPA